MNGREFGSDYLRGDGSLNALHLARKTYNMWRTEGTTEMLKGIARHLTKRSVQSAKYEHLQTVKMFGCADTLRLNEQFDYALKLPFAFDVPQQDLKIVAVVHIFYSEFAGKIKSALSNIPGKVDVFISTDTKEKQEKIKTVFADFPKGRVTIKVFPNRGRDIAPMLVGFSDVYDNYDVAVHIHSKKSLHDSKELDGWGEYLFNANLGSPKIVGDILHILSFADAGIVFPQHFYPVRDHINWGRDYAQTRSLLTKCGVTIDNRCLLDFPSGSMFWFKPQAVRPLLDLPLTFDKFPAENGQIDGTLAHAVERSFLYICESQGLKWVKITTESAAVGDDTTVDTTVAAELQNNIDKCWQSLLTVRTDNVF